MSSRSCSAYLFPARLVIHATAITRAGFQVAKEPYFSIEVPSQHEEIGKAVRQALDSHQIGIENPSNGREFQKAFLKGVGVKSNAALQRAAVQCDVLERENELNFFPTHNGGTTGDQKGYSPLNDHIKIIPRDSDDGVVGKALLDCFERCSSIYSEG